ncbi:gll2778 [Gloeobacter violaceus PCC 7421]|uniref:Gll2778 protein n=2 Tax=Gloeobacter violaceus TaxID=33072 RepID=Q7NGV9_GLOVI|nr:gll2778 [Gloeobacter violaceus PCC 7421]
MWKYRRRAPMPDRPSPIPPNPPDYAFKEEIQKHFEAVAYSQQRWRRRNRYYYADIEALCRFLIPAHSRVLQIGSGNGDLLASLEPAVGLGVDFSPSMVTLAREQHPELQFLCQDAEQLDLEGQTFDYILLVGVLGHLADIQSVLEGLRPCCHRRTRVVAVFHNYLWEPLLRLGERLGERMPQPAQNWLSDTDVRNLFAITGYTVVKQGRRMLLPRRVPLVADWLNRYAARLPLIEHLCLTQYLVARPDFGPQPAALPTCSVIVPARNEAGNIRAAVERLPALGSHTELLFVEGNSQDDTWQVIGEVAREYGERLDIRVFKQKGKGKGDAVRLAFEQAKGDILMILDADLTVPPEDLPKFYAVIASGRGEFINGSRLIYPRSREAMPWLNTLANKFFGVVFSFLLDQPLKDTLCGTKVLWREDYEKIAAGRAYFGDFDPFGDFDLLFGAAKLNLHIVEVPIRYQPRTYGQSNIAHFREGLVLLRMCLFASQRIKFN